MKIDVQSLIFTLEILIDGFIRRTEVVNIGPINGRTR